MKWELTIAKLQPEDDQMRKDLVLQAFDLIKKERIKVPKYAPEDVVDFALQWRDVDGTDGQNARRMLMNTLDEKGTRVLTWIFANYSHNRLYIIWQFTRNFGDWLTPELLVQYFGDLLKLFMALQGEVPTWSSGVPYQEVLSNGFIIINREYRTWVINNYLRDHWEEATELFEEHSGVPSEDFPKIPGVEYSHVYTQYKKLATKKARQYLKEHPEKYEEVRTK